MTEFNDEKILFIMGNGPSLAEIMNNEKYLNILRQNDTFGLNSVYRSYEKYNFYPTYFGCFDFVVNESHKENFEKLVLENNSIKEFYFIGNNILKQKLFKQEVYDNNKFIKFNFIPTNPDECVRLSENLQNFVNFGCSGANATQIGLMKGYKKIILLGCDCNYLNKIDEEKSLGINKQIEIVSEIKVNKNYWMNDYQHIGDRLNSPDAEKWHIPAWKNVEKFCHDKTEVINCSEISKIEFFVKIKFDNLFVKLPLKYNFNEKIIQCDIFNIDYEKLDNRIIQYKNVLYCCSFQNNVLILCPYTYSKWNELIEKVDFTFDVLKIPKINFSYIYGKEALIIPKKNLSKGISFVIRAKNEQSNIYFVLISLKNIVNNKNLNCEIIFVNNKSKDNTYNEVIRICNLEKINNVYLYNYNVDVFSSGNEHSKNYEIDVSRTLATYYNWCVERANNNYFIKWDCDFYAIQYNIIEMINIYNLNNSEEDKSIWFSGKTLYKYDENFFINTDTRYNEFRLFSKKHGANYVNVPRWEIISKDYLKNTKKIIYTKALFLEFKNINTKILLRDNFRDVHDNNIINKIKENKYINYINRYSFLKEIIKIDYNPLLPNCYQNKNLIFNNLVSNYDELTELQKYWILNYVREPKDKVLFNYHDNIIITGLWVGNKLDTLHKTCIESFINNNHLYLLYVYEHIDNLPNNVVLMDANEIIPNELIYKYDNSYAGFSDLFRNCLLYNKGGWYIDLDIYNLKKYDFEEKNIYSFDKYPTLTQKEIEYKSKNNEIIYDKYYIQTNPCKTTKNDIMFYENFKIILDKIFFGILNNNIKNDEEIMDFNLFFKKENLYDIYTTFYEPIKQNCSLKKLLILNNINKINLNQKTWGEIGPLLCTKQIIKYKREEKCFVPEILQGPFDYHQVSKYLEKDFDYKQLKNTYSLDFFYTMWKRKDILKYVDNNNYIKDTLLESLLNYTIYEKIKI